MALQGYPEGLFLVRLRHSAGINGLLEEVPPPDHDAAATQHPASSLDAPSHTLEGDKLGVEDIPTHD